MSGWFKSTVAGWESVIAFIPKPWPRDAAINDLAYLADRSKMTGEQIPGRQLLSERWGWSSKKTRILLENIKRASEGPGQGPAKGQVRGQRETFEPKESQEKGPAKGQPRARSGASEGPALHLYTDTDIQTQTEKEKVKKEKVLPDSGNQAPLSEDEVEGAKGYTHSSPPTISESEKIGVEPHTQRQTEPAGLAPLPAASWSNSCQTHEESVSNAYPYKDTMETQNEHNAFQDGKEGHTGAGEVVPFRRELQGTQGLHPRQQEENPAFEVDDYALFVKHWLSRKPGAVPHISSKPAQFVRDCIRRHKLKACINVIDWVHDSKHTTAVFLHEKGAVTFNALFNPDKEANYINLAADWAASGRKSQAPKQERNPFDTESGWEGSRNPDLSGIEPLDEETREAFGDL